MNNQKLRTDWNNYQKEIADDNYYYARSCIRQNFFPGSETALFEDFRDELGKNIFDDKNHTTCTGIGYHSDIVPFETIQTVVARQFSLMAMPVWKIWQFPVLLLLVCITKFSKPGKNFLKRKQKQGKSKKSYRKRF